VWLFVANRFGKELHGSRVQMDARYTSMVETLLFCVCTLVYDGINSFGHVGYCNLIHGHSSNAPLQPDTQ